MTCEECRWKTERGECPCDYDYLGTDYAEDCDDFRYDKFPETAFKEDEKCAECKYADKPAFSEPCVECDFKYSRFEQRGCELE